VSFKAFSLDQAHVEEGGVPVWEQPDRYPGLLANLAGIAVRDNQPDRFLAVHGALFAARHEHSLDLRDRTVVAKVIDEAGGDGAGALSEVDSGRPLAALRDEHTWAVDEHKVFGVPTFVIGSQATFIRIMRGPAGDQEAARQTIDRIVDTIVGWPELNEFKHTSLSS
jgi:2-hydroxychromene-2-carboxylate isomerase